MDVRVVLLDAVPSLNFLLLEKFLQLPVLSVPMKILKRLLITLVLRLVTSLSVLHGWLVQVAHMSLAFVRITKVWILAVPRP